MARDAMPASTDPRASLFFSTDCDEAQQRFNPFHLSFLLYKIEVHIYKQQLYIYIGSLAQCSNGYVEQYESFSKATETAAQVPRSSETLLPPPVADKMMAAPMMMSRADWQPDAAATQCSHCAAAFTWLHRRHHCRHCGRLVCGSCSNKMLPLLPSSAVSAAAPLTAIQCTDGIFTATVSPVSLHGGSDGDTPGESQSSIGAPMQWCRVCDRCYTRLTALPPRRSQLPPEAPPRPSSPLQGVVLRPPCPPAPLLQCPSPESAQPIRHLPVVSLAPSALERQARRRRSICVLLLDERSGDDVSGGPRLHPLAAAGRQQRLVVLHRAHAHSHTPEYTILRALVGSLTSDYRDMADDSFHFACSGRAALLPAPAFLCSASAVSALTSRSAKGKVFAAPEPGVQRWEMEVRLAAPAPSSEVFHAPITVLGAAERLGRRQRLLAASALGHAASLPEATERFPSVSETLLGRLTKIPCSPTSFVLVVLRSAGGELMRQRQDGAAEEEAALRAAHAPRAPRQQTLRRLLPRVVKKYGAAPHMSVIDVAMTVDGLAESPPANLAVLEAMNDLQRAVLQQGCTYTRPRRACGSDAFGSSSSRGPLGRWPSGSVSGCESCTVQPRCGCTVQDELSGELAVHIEQLVSRMILRDEELYQNEIMNSLC
eukprot:gene327-181_t